MASRREVTRREVAALTLGSAVLAIVMTWPLVLDLGTVVPKDLTDPLPQAWQVAWGGYALIHQPLEFFQSNQFWPLDDTLAFSDALIGYAPAGLVGSGPEAAIARYDLLFIFSYALAFAGGYLLARELGLGPLGAIVAGAAFAFAPFRLEQDRHLHVISSGGIPLALAIGLRGYRLAKPGWVFAGFCVAAWQFSIGPTLGLPLTYLLALLAVVAAVVWWRRGRPPLDRRLRRATIAGVAAYVAVVAVISLPYLRVASEQPDSERPPSTIEAFSGPATIFALAPAENPIWGEVTLDQYRSIENPGEKTLFPGLAILGLAIAGLGPWSPFGRRLRIGLGAGVVVVSILALGFTEAGGWLWPYRIAYDVIPGWDGMRTPGRLATFSSLGLALLAGAGAAALGTALGRRFGRAVAVALAAVLVAVIATEGRTFPFDPDRALAQPEVPTPPADFSGVSAPQFFLPAYTADDNRRYLLWSTDGFPDLVNGRSSIQPEYTQGLVEAMDDFPDPASVALLRETGVRSVVVDLRRVEGTPQDSIYLRPWRSLGIERELRGQALIFTIDPEPG